MNTISKIKPQVRTLSPYTLKQYEYEIKINQNENPLDLPQQIKQEVLAFALERSWSRYPPFVPEELIIKLAEYTSWTPEGILIGNGSNELIEAIFMVTVSPGTRVVIPVPTFTLYKLMGSVLGADTREVYLKSDYAFDSEALYEAVKGDKADLLIVASPNNPTGCTLSNAELERILESTEAIVVLDEAYHEFSGGTALPLLKDHSNLIILRTFSKAFALAGLRVGYSITHPELSREIAKAKLPYNINFFSQVAAIKVLENREILTEHVRYLVSQRDIVFSDLSQIDGVKAYPSQANFILFETKLEPKYVFGKLLEKGVLVRDVSSYPMLSKALRVSIGIEDENRRFLDVLKEIISAGETC